MTPALAPPAREVKVRLKRPHARQLEFINSPAKRKVIRAGRRGGKTTGVSILATRAFLAGKRVLYGTPTDEQIASFWFEVKAALAEAIDVGVFVKNETLHTIEEPGTKRRIRAKTCWDANTLRGDYADLLILDEYQLMNEDAWEIVGAPMLLDNDGDAVFVYTPPSLRSRARSKAQDPRHAAKMFKRAQADQSGRWEAFHFTSHDNPHISAAALADITMDMTNLAIRQEIDAEDLDDAPGALWTRKMLDDTRLTVVPEDLVWIVIGVDPPGGATECGIVGMGKGRSGHRYVLKDGSLKAPPNVWANAVIDLYLELKADRIVAEANFGGDMVESTILAAAKARGVQVRFRLVHASRGKAVRAEPVVAGYERGEVHHVGAFPQLEDEMTLWVPGETLASPNRIDACVWAGTELGGRGGQAAGF
jgi:hypothetical protein